EPVDEIHAETIALQGRQHPRLLGDEGKYASDRIPNRRGPDGALSDLKPRIANIDVAEIPHRLRCCGQVAGCAIEPAAELDLERLRAHQQRSQLVEGRTKAGSHPIRSAVRRALHNALNIDWKAVLPIFVNTATSSTMIELAPARTRKG